MKLRHITYLFLFLMLLSPLLSYVSFGVLDLLSIRVYFQLISVLYGIVFIFLNYKNIKISSFEIFALLFFIYVFIWSFYNGEMERRGFFAILINNSYLPIFFILVIIYNTHFSKKFIISSIKIFAITVLFAFVVTLIQVFDVTFFNAGPLWNPDSNQLFHDIYTNRRASIFGYIDQNALGLSFIPFLSVLVGYLLINKSSSVSIFLFSGAVIAFLSNTRYIMVAFVLITLQYFVMHKDYLKAVSKYSTLLFAVLALSLVILNFVGYDFQNWYQERLFREGSIEQTTRYQAIGNFLYFFPQYPILGNGSIMDDEVVAASRLVSSSHIHVGYLSHLVAYGIAGCFFLFTCWILLLKKLYNTAKLTNYWGSFFAFLTFLWAFATFSMSSLFFYGLLFAFVFDKYHSDKKDKI